MHFVEDPWFIFWGGVDLFFWAYQSNNIPVFSENTAFWSNKGVLAIVQCLAPEIRGCWIFSKAFGWRELCQYSYRNVLRYIFVIFFPCCIFPRAWENVCLGVEYPFSFGDDPPHSVAPGLLCLHGCRPLPGTFLVQVETSEEAVVLLPAWRWRPPLLFQEQRALSLLFFV